MSYKCKKDKRERKRIFLLIFGFFQFELDTLRREGEKVLV